MHLPYAIAALAGAVVFAAWAPIAQAQNSDDDRSSGRWELLGEKKVGLWLDRDVIKLDQNDEWYKERRYRRIRFDVEDNDIHLNRVRLVYFNDYDENLRVERLIREGEQYSLRLDGDRGYVRQIELDYRSRLNFDGRATVKIYGELAQYRDRDRVAVRDGARDRDRDAIRDDSVRDRDRDAIRDDSVRDRERNATRDDSVRDRERNATRDDSVRDRARNANRDDDVRDRDRAAVRDDVDDRDEDERDRRWVELGCRRVSLADRDRDTIDVSKREGWYRAIRLRAEGNDVEVMRVDVVYGNSAPDELDVRRIIRDGRRSRAIDLKGSEKSIEQIQLVYRRLSDERGRTTICVDGLLAG